MSKLLIIQNSLLVHIIVFFGSHFTVLGLSRNASIVSKRSSDALFGPTNPIDRQFPFDASFLLPHLIVGVFIPIAVIIGIGVVLMKLFIIGFWLLGRGGHGFGQNVNGYYPWRVDQQQHHTARSLLDSNGADIPNYLSSTIWNLIEKVSSSLEKFDKYKI